MFKVCNLHDIYEMYGIQQEFILHIYSDSFIIFPPSMWTFLVTQINTFCPKHVLVATDLQKRSQCFHLQDKKLFYFLIPAKTSLNLHASTASITT